MTGMSNRSATLDLTTLFAAWERGDGVNPLQARPASVSSEALQESATQAQTLQRWLQRTQTAAPGAALSAHLPPI